MTKLLKSMLREDYLIVIKTKMLNDQWNNSALSRRTGYSQAHIGNLLNGRGSDDALAAVCNALGINIRDLFKETAGGEDGDQAIA